MRSANPTLHPAIQKYTNHRWLAWEKSIEYITGSTIQHEIQYGLVQQQKDITYIYILQDFWFEVGIETYHLRNYPWHWGSLQAKVQSTSVFFLLQNAICTRKRSLCLQ